MTHLGPIWTTVSGTGGRYPKALGGALGVAVLSPALDDDLCFPERVEDFPVQQRVAEPGIETLGIAIHPRAPRLDVGRPGADCCDPVPSRLSDELGAIARQEAGGFRRLWLPAQPPVSAAGGIAGSQVSKAVLRTARQRRPAMTAPKTAPVPPLLVAIDISKYRHEVLIGVPGKASRRAGVRGFADADLRFPGQPPRGSACPASDPGRPFQAAHSPSAAV